MYDALAVDSKVKLTAGECRRQTKSLQSRPVETQKLKVYVTASLSTEIVPVLAIADKDRGPCL